MSPKVGHEWFPLLSHMILSLGVFNGVQCVTCTVDPDYPDVWKDAPYYQQLKAMSLRGLHVRSADEILLVHIRIHDRVWLVLPEKDIEITHGSYVVKLIGAGKWGVEQFDDTVQASERVNALLDDSRNSGV